jgi:predicted nucleic acid-binding Zn ribbon protein
MTETDRSCLKCSGSIPPDRRADARFCSEACKLAAEYERRRIERRLGQLEDSERQWRQFPGYEHHLATVQGRIAEDEARLRVLLGAEEG